MPVNQPGKPPVTDFSSSSPTTTTSGEAPTAIPVSETKRALSAPGEGDGIAGTGGSTVSAPPRLQLCLFFCRLAFLPCLAVTVKSLLEDATGLGSVSSVTDCSRPPCHFWFIWCGNLAEQITTCMPESHSRGL